MSHIEANNKCVDVDNNTKQNRPYPFFTIFVNREVLSNLI